MTWSGFITNDGINQARNATNNPGWYLIPYKFKVSSTKGYLNANSVIDDLTNIWYEAYFTSLEFLENNKILHKITIPIDAESISKNIGDIAFIYKDPDDNEYLFAVSKNSDTLSFEPGISREYDFAFTLNNTNVADIYNIQYTFPQDIATHNIDPTAHVYLLARDGNRTATNPILYENVTDDALLENDNSFASVNLVKNLFKNYITYSVNSGNVDANGYADLIEKISDTEVSFKVGGAYPNMGITFPNGKHYEISSIPNVSGLDSDGLYKYCIFESNLVKLENGTYGGIVTPVKTMYQYYNNANILTGFTSNTKGGITVSATHGGSNAYLAVDGDSGTAWGGAGTQTYCGNPYPFVPRSGVPVDYFIDFDTPRSFWKFSIKQHGSWWAYGELYLSGDAGNTWTKACGFSGNNNGTEAVYVFSEFKNMPVNKVRVKFNGLGVWHNSGGDCGTMGMQIQSMGLYETVTFEGGQITEGHTAPAERKDGDLHCYTNQRPLKPVLYIDEQEIEAQFVNIGESTKLDVEMGTPITYAFNARTVIKQNVTTNANYSFNHYLGYAAENILYDGYFHNISDTEESAAIPNGSSGYKLGVGADASDISDIRRVNSLSLMLYTGSTWIYQGAKSAYADFGAAQVVIHLWRAF